MLTWSPIPSCNYLFNRPVLFSFALILCSFQSLPTFVRPAWHFLETVFAFVLPRSFVKLGKRLYSATGRACFKPMTVQFFLFSLSCLFFFKTNSAAAMALALISVSALCFSAIYASPWESCLGHYATLQTLMPPSICRVINFIPSFFPLVVAELRSEANFFASFV